VELVVVSGLSGSGKTVALRALEDAGYYCLDNLPATLLDEALDFLGRSGHARVAVSVDARSAALGALAERIAALRAQGVGARVLFLEATPEALLRRYAETRRRHPLADGERTLAEAIERERALLAGVRELGARIDTSGVAPAALRQWLRQLLGLGDETFALAIESFAYRDGLPLDADWVIDARAIPNPHYDERLRPLTGRDPEVAAFLAAQEAAQRLCADVRTLLERWLPELARDRSVVTVAIGCTGGRHRSVYLAERLAGELRSRYRVLVRHRALEKEGGA